MSAHRRPQGRAWRALAAAAATSTVAVLVPAGMSQAGEARSLVAGASAQGMRITYTIPDQFAVSTLMDGGGPLAQANVDTTGKAIGFASLPYPGENGVSAPGLLTFATGQQFPAYPFYAEANHPVQPSDEVKDPSGWYTLKAAAQAGRATGSALMNFGGPDAPASRSTADASGATDAAGTTLEAVSVNDGLTFGGGVLKIASVTSRSVTSYTAGAKKPETRNSLAIEGASVGGRPVTIGPDGVHAGDSTVPGPVDGGASAELLKQAGITVRTVSSEPVEGGAALQVLEVTVKHPVPGAAVQGTIVYQVGGASTFIILGDEQPGLDLDETAPIDAQPAPVASAQAAPAGASPQLPAAGPATSSIHRTVPALSGATSAAADRPVPPLAAPLAVPSPAASQLAPVTSELAAPAVAARPVVSIRDLRDQMKPILLIAGLGGAALLAACATWCLRKAPAGS